MDLLAHRQGHGLQLAKVLVPFVMPIRRLVGRFQSEQHRGGVLSEMVVQLARHALAFILLRRNQAINQPPALIQRVSQVIGQRFESFLAMP